jgi:hypothetical protein
MFREERFSLKTIINLIAFVVLVGFTAPCVYGLISMSTDNSNLKSWAPGIAVTSGTCFILLVRKKTDRLSL